MKKNLSQARKDKISSAQKDSMNQAANKKTMSCQLFGSHFNPFCLSAEV